MIDSKGSLEGTTSGAAAQAGIPGVIAEAGGIGQLEEPAVGLLTHGAINALKYLNVLDGDAEPSASQTVGRFEWVYGEPAGFWGVTSEDRRQSHQG